MKRENSQQLQRATGSTEDAGLTGSAAAQKKRSVLHAIGVFSASMTQCSMLQEGRAIKRTITSGALFLSQKTVKS